MWMLLSFLVAFALAEPEVSSTRCHYRGVCAGRGWCDDWEGSACGPYSPESCRLSDACLHNGNCKYRPRSALVSCIGDDPTQCDPDGLPCKTAGRCRPGKPDSLIFCQATPQGCRESEFCRLQGACKVKTYADGQRFCVDTAKGCRESLDCKRVGKCGFDKKKGICVYDAKACPESLECRKLGACFSTGGMCQYSDEGCKGSELCALYGGCSPRMRYCPPGQPGCVSTACEPTTDAECQASRICKTYGACKHRESIGGRSARCATTSEALTCEMKTVPLKAITASTTQSGFADLSLEATNLVDHDYRTSWAPDPATPFPHRLTIELGEVARVAGIRMATGFHRVHAKEGFLVHAFGIPLGVAIFTDGKPHDAFRLRRTVEWQEIHFNPIETRTLDLELFDAFPGKRFDHYAITDIEVLVCETAVPKTNDVPSPDPEP